VRKTFIDHPSKDQPSRFRLATSALSMVVAVVLTVALGVKIMDLVAGKTFDAERYFSYYSLLLAVVSVVVLLVSALLGTRGTRDGPRVASARAVLALSGAAILITHTSLFSLAPGVASDDLGAQIWPDTIIHVVLPSYLIGEWILNPLRARISRWTIAVALLVPFAWLFSVFTLSPFTVWRVNQAIGLPAAEDAMVRNFYFFTISVLLLVTSLLLLMANRVHYRLFPKNLFES
jgi:hypothetical protein